MTDIIWTKRATQNLFDIGTYIAFDSPRSAENVVRRIVETVSGLSFYPKIGRAGKTPNTRELVITGTPYIAVYRVHERVEILTVYHAARKFPH